MKTIELNEQQVDYLKQIIEYGLQDTFTDTTTLTIGRQIISKLEEDNG